MTTIKDLKESYWKNIKFILSNNLEFLVEVCNQLIGGIMAIFFLPIVLIRIPFTPIEAYIHQKKIKKRYE